MQKRSSPTRGARWALVALAALALAAAVPAAAQPSGGAGGPGGPGGPPPGPGFRHHGPPPIDRILERHADRLGLDKATLAKIHDIAAASEEASRPDRDRMHAMRDHMRELLSADTPDEPAVMKQADEMGALETTIHKERLSTMLKIRALLTPEQRKELVKIHEEMMREHRGRWRKGRGMGPGGGPGGSATPAPPPEGATTTPER